MKRTILCLLFIVILSLLATACGAISASEPTATSTVELTATPTAEPTTTSTVEPTATPTAEPTATLEEVEEISTQEIEPADKAEVVNSFDASRSELPEGVEVTGDVVYAMPLQPDVTEQRLDIYTPEGAADGWPVVVFLHGYDGTKEWYAPLSQAIAEQGAVVFTAAWPTWIPDLAARENGKGFREMSEVLSCAIRFARATASDYGGDPSQMTLVGHSYGAGTGAWIALAGDNLDRLWEEFASTRGGPPSQVECVVSGGSANVDAFVGIGGSYDDFAGKLQERDPELWQIADPYAHLGQNLDLRVRLIHGERDSMVRPEHTVQFNDVLVEAGYDTSLTLWDGKHRVPLELTVAEVIEVAGE